ncbi:virulence RhuM family protein [Bacteroidales bacterium OttesenSCG-928-K03]|nr:virulence RhuM family protein [Odoribacter sp. OttesenSCG-928-L07]MDL2239645.1 virulence RhuM family protein [Bacteroidales bacterium OttesenSCG-928-L14]MDL2242453.1 virulence RhuM family protein [Bacteroidales bacterium OttesenSCG-928-K03]
MSNNNPQPSNSQFVLYQDDNGITNVNVRFDGQDVWLSQQQIALLFDTTRENIVQHIRNIYQEAELQEDRTCKNFLQVQTEGKRSVKRNIPNYNLDMIIAIGYRVKSQVATRFRQWATQRLHEYIQKGFTMDDERLKGNGNRYFRELLQRVRDIRSSERNLYQQVTDIYATAIDYDPNSDVTRSFFATVQNKMHYAAHQHTAAEVIYQRVDSEKPMVGMTNFKGDYITRDDVKIAKNYLSEKELQVLNLLVSQYLDFAELQALEQQAMTMQQWIEKLDNILMVGNRPLLNNAGTISHKQAIEKATQEFEEYRRKEMLQYESDFDRAIKELKEQSENNDKE